jgi:methyl-accepting chemotaxis protein
MQWTIGKKLYLAFAFIAAMMMIGTGFEHWVRSRAEATQQAIAKTDTMLYDLEYLIAYLREVTVVQRAFLISGDEAQIAGLPALRKDADEVAARVQAGIAADPAQSAHFTQYLEYLRQRRAFVNKLNAARKNEGFEVAKALFDTGEDNRLLQQMQAEFDAMKSAAQANLAAERHTDSQVQSFTNIGEIVSLALALLILSAVAFTLTRSISRNVQISVEMVGAMARKDLSGEDGHPTTTDELATAIYAINTMKHAMTDALSEVARSSEQVAAAGAQIESTSREIATTTHEEKRNVEHFASSIAEMNAAVQDVAENAERAAQSAIEAVSATMNGREVLDQTRSAMNRISDSVRTASSDIARLGTETESIGEVVRIIQGIAGQTNLLALNAAIEAARAGEQGKGFAVVAQEVRQLAESTAKFTKEIAAKIETVQQGASRAVHSMHQGEAVVTEGMAQFGNVSIALQAVTERIQAAQQGISIIATASTQQSAATAGLAQNIHEISSEVSQTVEQVDQTAAACAELSKLSSALQRIVDGFQLPRPGRR